MFSWLGNIFRNMPVYLFRPQYVNSLVLKPEYSGRDRNRSVLWLLLPGPLSRQVIIDEPIIVFNEEGFQLALSSRKIQIYIFTNKFRTKVLFWLILCFVKCQPNDWGIIYWQTHRGHCHFPNSSQNLSQGKSRWTADVPWPQRKRSHRLRCIRMAHCWPGITR